MYRITDSVFIFEALFIQLFALEWVKNMVWDSLTSQETNGTSDESKMKDCCNITHQHNILILAASIKNFAVLFKGCGKWSRSDQFSAVHNGIWLLHGHAYSFRVREIDPIVPYFTEIHWMTPSRRSFRAYKICWWGDATKSSSAAANGAATKSPQQTALHGLIPAWFLKSLDSFRYCQ